MESSPLLENQPRAESLAGKYLTVGLQGEVYALAVVQVREIIRLTKITPVAQMPSYVSGVMNLRGKIIPVIDLRLKFGLEAVAADRTCIVVVEAATHGRESLMGLVVDEVVEVVSLSEEQIVPPAYFGGSGLAWNYLLGMAKAESGVKMVLDVNRVAAVDVIDPGLLRAMADGGNAE